MNRDLLAFINRLFQYPTVHMPLSQFVEEFHEWLGPDRAKGWIRGRIVSELASGGFKIGTIDRVAHVAGLAPRSGHWDAERGNLKFFADEARARTRTSKEVARG